MDPDADAMAENAEREIQEMKKKPVPVSEQEDEVYAKKTDWRGLINMIGNGTTQVTYSKKKKGSFATVGNTTFTGFDLLGGNRGVWQAESEKNTHHNKGVCQESYDQGYEDGLKAAKEGDTRIK